MTTAVCFRCGKLKFGAFVPCGECGEEPRSEDELALSLAMTDHYFDEASLRAMGQRVAEGEPPQLSPETRAGLIQTLRESGIMTTMQRVRDRAEKAAHSPQEHRRQPWWKFW